MRQAREDLVLCFEQGIVDPRCCHVGFLPNRRSTIEILPSRGRITSTGYVGQETRRAGRPPGSRESESPPSTCHSCLHDRDNRAALIESTTSRPTPGQEKTTSTITAPPSRKPICRPASVVTGISALRIAWRSRIFDSFRPFGSRGSHVVRLQYVDHARSEQARERPGVDDAERHGRHDQRLPRSGAALRPRPETGSHLRRHAE